MTPVYHFHPIDYPEPDIPLPPPHAAMVAYLAGLDGLYFVPTAREQVVFLCGCKARVSIDALLRTGQQLARTGLQPMRTKGKAA